MTASLRAILMSVVAALETLKKTLQISELPQEIAKMREKTKPVWDKHTPQVGAELVKEVQAEIAKVRSK